MTSSPPQVPPQQLQPPTTVRKVIVEVVDARGLLPKDGQGSSSPYVVADFDGQRKRTSTKYRDLNPVWNEQLEFIVTDPSTMEDEELEIEVYNDKKMLNGGGVTRKNHFLGRVKLYGTQFWRRGDEGLIYFPLEKKSVFTWIRGEIGLKIYYFDEQVEEPRPPEGEPPPPPPPTENQPAEVPPPHPQPVVAFMSAETMEVPVVPTEIAREVADLTPPMVTVEQSPTPPPATDPSVQDVGNYSFPPEVRKMQTSMVGSSERVKVARRSSTPNNNSSSEFAPRAIPGRFPSETERINAYDLVEPMQYLFVRIVKARGLSSMDNPHVKIRAGPHLAKSKKPPILSGAGMVEWNQVFNLPQNRPDSGVATIEISVWDPTEQFLGGVCLDLSDVPVRDPPESPLAPQWYRLEGGDDPQNPNSRVSGDIQLSVWIGTQADDAFPESWSSDVPGVAHTRSKVYQSPKLWYLRITVIEAQDIHFNNNYSNSPPSLHAPTTINNFDIRVKAQLGFQSARTRRGVMNNASLFWNEDLIFVTGETLEDHVILLVEDRASKEAVLLGHTIAPLSSIEQRLDERHVGSKWLSLEGGSTAMSGTGGVYCGRINVRMCLEGGYHVLDEAAHVCSDYRPTAKQLWKPAIGVLELGILGARGLLPMKTMASPTNTKGSTDAYCVAKYGKKWVRTKTIADSFDPRWNEQYTWQVYDPCTVLTIGVFDNWRMFADVADDNPNNSNGATNRPLDYRIGKVRIRVSTLESNKVYRNSYPLVIIRSSGLKKMGEIELAVRFACPYLLPDTCAVYGQPMLPRMHYIRPIGVTQQEALRGAATRIVSAWLARSEPPLGPEVIRYMLDTDSHVWSMRRSKANWLRIVAVLGWVVGLARWVDDIRRWRNPVTTVLVHVLYLVLVWYPDLIVPTAFLYVFLIGVWYYRFRPRVPTGGMDVRLSQADRVDPDELDEEFDPIPSVKPAEVIRVRYDRLRMVAGRVQGVLGDIATQGERVEALVSWRDPRATRLFIGVCLLVAVVLYIVPAKMVAVALGFYFLRHPMFRDPSPPASLNFFRRLPSLSDRLM
ncbi:hypothetical protein Sjap_023817 [Stephania japonica]|uniref:C2 domain-containing protein n=1 Tax=Stephania japonica TaxID=461633 RepID=A0AAP0ECB1_9MAGN